APNGHGDLTLQETASCGVSDVLPYPSTTGRIRARLRSALDAAAQLREERVVVREAPAPTPARLGHAMTVTSPTGRCGKTFVATNMAAYLTRATTGRVILVDLDLQFGEVALALRLKPERTIADIVDEDDV